ncbi:MAG: MMPL family transporter, partial [Muribaculaceae bacterium]|nr:MMPL family transporter [Muribaculaceae bacterium]
LIQVERLSPLFASLNDSAMVEDIRTCDRFLSSQQEQIKRLEQWNNFIAKHGKALENEVRRAAASQGFAQDSFNEFYNLLNNHFDVQNADYFEPIVTSVYSTQIIADTINGEYRAITTLTTTADKIGNVKAAIKAQDENALVFDINNVNSTIATNLSDNFNYIGWACALIVFIFLWFSLGSIELALLSFLPMAVSWVWILGIMALLGIKFNVVNVILATFIFGQGDDYTIFMTEGCQYEYAYGRKMLASYKHSIIISALIMFIGIGSLIFAKHPALNSLAQVTIVGMFSVVLMAYLFPPLIFKWLIKRRDNLRQRPVTLRSLFAGNVLAATIAVQFVTFMLLSFATLKNSTKRKAWLRRRMASSLKFDILHLSPVRLRIDNAHDISSPATIAYNHESPLDFAFLMSVVPGIVVQHTDYSNKAVRTMLRLMTPALTDDCIVATDVANGHNCDAAIHLHGAALATPQHSIRVYRSEVTATITAAHDFEKTHNDLRQKCEDADFFALLIADTYRYRGVEIASKVRKSLKKRQNYKPWTAEYGTTPPASVTVINSGCGELPLLLALICPNAKITAIDSYSDNQALTMQCAHALGCDINIAASVEGIDLTDSTLFLLAPTSDDKARFAAFNPIIID